MVAKFTVDESNNDRFMDIEEDTLSDHCTGNEIDLEEFDVQDDEVFLEITNMESYRPGHVDRYAERDGKVYMIDDLNDDLAYEMDLTKDQVLEAFAEFIK